MVAKNISPDLLTFIDNNYEKTKIELSQLMNQSSGSRQGSYQNNSYSNRTTKPNPTRDYHNNYDGSDLAGQYQSSNSYGGYGEKNMEPNASNGKKKTSLVKKLKCKKYSIDPMLILL